MLNGLTAMGIGFVLGTFHALGDLVVPLLQQLMQGGFKVVAHFPASVQWNTLSPT
jgi:hypothetical protein